MAKFIRILVLIVVAMATASIFAFAFAAALAMAAICLIAFLTAYAINPEDVKSILRVLTQKLDGWFKELFSLIRSITDVLRDAAETAKSMTAAAAPAEDASKAKEEDAPAKEATEVKKSTLRKKEVKSE